MSYISISAQSGNKSDTFSRGSATQQDIDEAKTFLDGLTPDEPVAEPA